MTKKVTAHAIRDEEPDYEGGEGLLSGKVRIDEGADKCCFCIPIEIGVILIGLLIILSGINNILEVLNILGRNFT